MQPLSPSGSISSFTGSDFRLRSLRTLLMSGAELVPHWILSNSKAYFVTVVTMARLFLHILLSWNNIQAQRELSFLPRGQRFISFGRCNFKFLPCRIETLCLCTLFTWFWWLRQLPWSKASPWCHQTQNYTIVLYNTSGNVNSYVLARGRGQYWSMLVKCTICKNSAWILLENIQNLTKTNVKNVKGEQFKRHDICALYCKAC